MRSFAKMDFFWLFAGGFLLGTIGLFALQPGDAPFGLAHVTAAIAHQR